MFSTGQRAAGATAYVTLEPCNHFGRTPPCALALVAARVARVAFFSSDSTSHVSFRSHRMSGEGVQMLQFRAITLARTPPWLLVGGVISPALSFSSRLPYRYHLQQSRNLCQTLKFGQTLIS